jgi:hypothetical protein
VVSTDPPHLLTVIAGQRWRHEAGLGVLCFSWGLLMNEKYAPYITTLKFHFYSF